MKPQFPQTRETAGRCSEVISDPSRELTGCETISPSPHCFWPQAGQAALTPRLWSQAVILSTSEFVSGIKPFRWLSEVCMNDEVPLLQIESPGRAARRRQRTGRPPRSPTPSGASAEQGISAGFLASSPARKRICWLAALLVGCSPAVPESVDETFSAGAQGAYVYRCEGDRRLLVRMMGDSVRVQEDLYAVTLPLAPSASGARYSAGGATYWSKGRAAIFEISGGRLEDCQGDRAETPWELSRLLGYDLRGVGQEPGWIVEIDLDRRMHVLADYGEIEFFTSRPTVTTLAGRATAYRAQSPRGEVAVTVHEQSCEDVMSGEPSPRTVLLAFGGRELTGCGWSSEDPLPPASRP
jgi:membrane-bound inhibitor of C-type lysozyme/uncharacterized membrane protein